MNPIFASSCSTHFRAMSLITVGLLTLTLSAQDETLTNYKTGINTIFSGLAGSDYQEEYFYSDKLVSDRKVVYIKATTGITMSHNNRNVSYSGSGEYARVTGNNSGSIMYKLDRDLQWGRSWGDANGTTDLFLTFANTQYRVPRVNNTFYSAPFTLGSQTYDAATQVVGTTGPKPNTAITDTANYYWRGILDSVGDEWHVLTVADYDAFVSDTEGKSSDGKVLLFVVNPKTPCLTITTTGDAQFYTTPPKIYFVPKIHDQTTYFSTGFGGTIRFSLKDISGKQVFYRINGGSWSSGALNPILTSEDFSLGANKLEYYYAGNSAYIKTRTVVKEPTFPSAAEAHGHALWRNSDGLSAVRARLTREPYRTKYAEYKEDYVSGRARFDSIGGRGERIKVTAIAVNAFAALIEGWTALPPGKNKSYATYAKQMLLESVRTIDPVGFEINHSGRSIPARELFYRGYYDVSATFDLAFGYDILIANFKSNQYAGGITPVEDYFIRDQLAGAAFDAMMVEGNYTMQEYGDTGMWGTARNIGGLIAAMIMPAYSTPYYGTSGFDGNTTVFPFTPFPDTPLTWKKVLFDNNAPLIGYPNLHYRFGVEDYQIHADGHFDDRIGYYSYHLMGHCFFTLANMTKMHTSATYPRLEASFARATSGTLLGMKDISEGTGRFSCITILNRRFPNIASAGIPWIKNTGASGPESESVVFYLTTVPGPYGFAWYDDVANLQTAIAPTAVNIRIILN